MTLEVPLYQEIVDFWREAGPKLWFKHDLAFDEAIRVRFEAVHHAAARGELNDWAVTATGALGLLLLLDQFPRNMYRGSAHSYATDPLARSVARGAVEAGLDQEVEPELRPFFYLPFEHSEDLADQAHAVQLCERLGDPDTLKWAKLHREIILRFGRFPHRNPMLGRESTPEEIQFLKDGGFAG